MLGLISKNFYITISVLVISLLALWGVFYSSNNSGFKSSEFSFYSLSPEGQSGGRSVPASCPSDLHDDPNYGRACTVSNACGASASGTYQCGGVCNAVMPALPSRYGQLCFSEANSCGAQGVGAYSCSGTCTASKPAENDCSDVNIDIGTESIITDPPGCIIGAPGCNSWTTTIPGGSRTVNLGSSCSIAWDASPATRCAITGPGVNRNNEPAAGVFTTPRIGVETNGSATYTITCFNGASVAASKSFTCRLNPNFEEI